jgi:predicted transcriptional regulator
VYQVHDWAEVHRLFERERLSKSAIAKRLGMSRPTVIRLLGLQEPPCYRRAPAGSKLDAHKDAVAAMLDADPRCRPRSSWSICVATGMPVESPS